MGDVVASSEDRETRFRSPIHRCGSGWRRYDDTPVDYRSLAQLDVYRSEIEGDRGRTYGQQLRERGCD